MKIPNKRNIKYHFSPLRYPGGKTFLFALFDRIITKKALAQVTYVEPFAGGAGAGLALLMLERVDTIVINDLDDALYAFWRSAIYKSDEFIEKIYSTPITISEWKRQRSIYRDPHSAPFDLGFATFFMNRTNVSGIIEGGPIGGMEQRGKWKLSARFNRDGLAQRICDLASYKNRISVSRKTGLDVIKEYAKLSSVFIYIDPPYYEKGASLYYNHFGIEDHILLSRFLNDNTKVNWVLTYDHHPKIKSLYSSRKKYNYSLFHNAYESRRGKEILFLSDSLWN